MSIILLKALLGLLLVLLALLGMYTMFEVLGRKEKKYDIGKLKAVHLWNGYLFLLLLLATGALGGYLVAGGDVVLGAKATFHLVLALAAILLLLVKISYLRAYRLFSAQVAGFGLAIALLVIIAAAISSGYYLLVNGFSAERAAAYSQAATMAESKTPSTLRAVKASIDQRAGRKPATRILRSRC